MPGPLVPVVAAVVEAPGAVVDGVAIVGASLVLGANRDEAGADVVPGSVVFGAANSDGAGADEVVAKVEMGVLVAEAAPGFPKLLKSDEG